MRATGWIRRLAAVLVLSAAWAGIARADDASSSVQQPAEAQAISPPELTHFEQVAYPAEAAEQHVEGNVVLLLDIDELGRGTASMRRRKARRSSSCFALRRATTSR